MKQTEVERRESSLDSVSLWLAKSVLLLAKNIRAVLVFYFVVPMVLTVAAGVVLYAYFGYLFGEFVALDMQTLVLFGYGLYDVDVWVLVSLAVCGIVIAKGARLGGLHYLHTTAVSGTTSISESFLFGFKCLPKYLGNTVIAAASGLVGLLIIGALLLGTAFASSYTSYGLFLFAVFALALFGFVIKTAFLDLSSVAGPKKVLAFKHSWSLPNGRFWAVTLRLVSVAIVGSVFLLFIGGTYEVMPYEILERLGIEQTLAAPSLGMRRVILNGRSVLDAGDLFGTPSSYAARLVLSQLVVQFARSVGAAISAASRTTIFVDKNVEDEQRSVADAERFELAKQRLAQLNANATN